MKPTDKDPLANPQDTDTTEAEGGSTNDLRAQGVGSAERNTVDATRRGMFPGDNTSGERSQGEVPGAGSIYAATFNERPNTSNPRNQGPERAPSRIGSSRIPIVSQASRNTGKVG